MLLTIGMIVKNEEKNLEACLNGLKPILEQVDSELIIADTGSTDRTVEIARQFTDNVFYFEWIKDFAAARNSTLERAQGEWFMYVDADEVFGSCDEIIDFFNSGEYKKYNSASYIQRNISRKSFKNIEEDETYSDFRAPRMTKILPETKFYKPIHECLNTYNDPIKYFDDYVIHTGYTYALGTEEAEEKYKRNAELLIKRLETDGESPLLYLQLYESMVCHDDDKAEEFLEKGIALAKKQRSVVAVPLYEKKATGLYGDKKFESALETCEEYFKLDKKIRPGVIGTDTEIVCCQAICLFNLQRYEESIDKFVRFFELFKDYTNGKLQTQDIHLTSRSFVKPGNFLPVLQKFVIACMKCDRFNMAAEYLKMLPIDKYSDIPAQIYDLTYFEMEVLEHFGYADILKFYKRFNETGRKIFKERLYRRFFEGKDEIKIANAILELKSEDEGYNEATGIYLDFFKEGTVSVQRILHLNEISGLNSYPDMLYIAAAAKIDLSEIIKLDGFDVKKAVCYCYAYIKNFHSVLEAYSSEYIEKTEDLPAFAEFMLSAMKAAITVKRRGALFCIRNIDKLFEIYGEAGARFCSASGIGENDTALHISAAMAAEKIRKCREAKDYKGCIAEMRRAIEHYPEIAAVIAEYRKAVIKEYESAQPQNEMQRLAAMIKSNIRNYIASGNIVAAANTLAEYEKINPSDPDIEGLKGLLN